MKAYTYLIGTYFECGTDYKLHSQVSTCLKILDAGQEIAFLYVEYTIAPKTNY